MSHQRPVAEPPMNVPNLFTARYLAEEVLTSGKVVPVWIGFGRPVVPVSYKLEEIAETLVPTGETILRGEWRPLGIAYWQQLDDVGLDRIAGELAEISTRHAAGPLALVAEDDLQKGHRDLRVVAAAWLEDHLGRPVYELTDEDRKLHYKELPRRVQPKRPKRHDPRWTHNEEPIHEWPLSEDDIRAWVAARHWQFARTTPHNPHEYTHREWGDQQMFFRVITHIREHGRREVYGGDVYTVFDLDGSFYWSMGDPTPCTVILNRKFHDLEARARLAEERTGRNREELGLHTQTLRRSGRVEEGRLGRTAQLKLSNIDNKKEG